MVNKLAHHFGRGIQVAVITQGVKSLEELLLLLTKWEGIDNQSNGSNNNETSRKNVQYQPQTKQPQSQQQQHKMTNINTTQKFNTNKVAVVTEIESDVEQSKKNV